MQANPLSSLLRRELQAHDNIVNFSDNILEFNLWADQRKILDKFYERYPDGTRLYNELVLMCGMRSSKTTIASIIATYECYRLLQYRHPALLFGLPKGKEIFIMNVATSADQSRDTIFAEIKNRIDNSEWFQGRGFKEHYDDFIFQPQNVILRSGHANSSGLVGRTCKVALFDELSRFKDTRGKSSASWVYESLSRSVSTFKLEGLLVTTTSPTYISDYGMQLLKKCGTLVQGNFVRQHIPLESGPLKYMLGLHYATWEINPNYTRDAPFIESEFEKNPEAALRDFGAVPSAALEAYFKEPDRIDNCIESLLVPVSSTGHLDGAWMGYPTKAYFLAGDPSLKNDAFGFALMHLEGKKCIIDLLHRFKPQHQPGLDRLEIDPLAVGNFVQSLAQRCNLRYYVTDIWNYPETIAKIRKMGVRVLQNMVLKKEYDNLKELIYSNPPNIAFYYYEPLLRELKELELVRGVKVDHPKGGSKDVADALANVCYLPQLTGVATWRPPKLASLESRSDINKRFERGEYVRRDPIGQII